VKKKTLPEVDPARLRDRVVLVRADLNVPLDGCAVADDQRIRASMPTLTTLVDAGARVVLLSHLGRPDGAPDPALSLRPVAERLGELMGATVRFIPESHGRDAAPYLADLSAGSVALLENTRFLAGETRNDAELGAAWAGLGELFVNDAFGTAHRAHASTAATAMAMKAKGGEAVAGLLMARELRFLDEALRDPRRPFLAVIGGAKISSKIGVLSELLPRVDELLIGGAMANTFFAAMGIETGDSLVEVDAVDLARSLLHQGGDRLRLPVDCIVAHELEDDAETRAVPREGVSDDDRIVDIGPESRKRYAERIRSAGTIVWNGPMGVFEIESFAGGTVAVASAVADACDGGALGIVGGGDSAAAAERAGVVDRLTHVSTGGGASLELLAGGALPGVDALSDL